MSADPSMLNWSLNKAARNGDVNECKRLMAQGADINAKQDWGWTHLHRAAYDNQTLACKTLLAAGADWRILDPENATAFHIAASWNQVGACRALIDGGVDMEAVDKYGKTALHRASGSKSTADACQFLLENGANLHAADQYGQFPLHSAALLDNLDGCRLLVGAGASPSDVPRELASLTPFQWAVRHNAVKVISYFVLECGEDPCQITVFGQTMLDLCDLGHEPERTREMLMAMQTEKVIRSAISVDDAPAVPRQTAGMAPF